MKFAVISGGMDPIHSGHIQYIKNSKIYGDKLIVLLNSDKWLTRKKGKPFMPFEERKAILENFSDVDAVFAVKDSDGSVIKGLQHIRELYGEENEYVFCNGGDRGKDNIPEMDVEGYEFVFGVGGETKVNSSSWILEEWKYPKEERVWGEFYELFHKNKVKVKELVIKPGKGISYQRHFKRKEIWLISEGTIKIKHSIDSPEKFSTYELQSGETFIINKNAWHQAYNPFDKLCRIIEIQYGEECNEEDIERLEYYKHV